MLPNKYEKAILFCISLIVDHCFADKPCFQASSVGVRARQCIPIFFSFRKVAPFQTSRACFSKNRLLIAAIPNLNVSHGVSNHHRPHLRNTPASKLENLFSVDDIYALGYRWSLTRSLPSSQQHLRIRFDPNRQRRPTDRWCWSGDFWMNCVVGSSELTRRAPHDRPSDRPTARPCGMWLLRSTRVCCLPFFHSSRPRRRFVVGCRSLSLGDVCLPPLRLSLGLLRLIWNWKWFISVSTTVTLWPFRGFRE